MPPPAPKLPGYEGHRLSNKLGKYWNESNSDNPLDNYNKNHPTSASFLVNHGTERRAALAEEKSKIDRENLVNSKRNIAPPPVAPPPPPPSDDASISNSTLGTQATGYSLRSKTKKAN